MDTSDLSNRSNKLFLDLSLHWSSFTDDEKQVLLGLMGLGEAQTLANAISAFRISEKSLKMQFLLIAEVIIQRYSNKEETVTIQAHEELQKDYCLLYMRNEQLKQRLERFERKHLKRQAKQERVKRYFALRNKKPWQLQQKKVKSASRPEEKLDRPLNEIITKKRLVKGTDEYDEEKTRLDKELDDYQNRMKCDQCPGDAVVFCRDTGARSCVGCSGYRYRKGNHVWEIID